MRARSGPDLEPNTNSPPDELARAGINAFRARQYSLARAAAPSEDPRFPVRSVGFDSLVTQPSEIDRRVLAVGNQLRDRSAGGRSVHHSVAGKSGDRVEVRESTVPASDHRVTVEF